MSADTPQQANMFTGAWETKRTRSRPQQMQMFSINETFVFGERVRPWLSEAGAPTLALICEDVRTPEEIERDLMREAEALNHKTFVETPGMYDCKRTPLIGDGSSTKDITENGDKPEQQKPENKNDQSPPAPVTPTTSERVTKLSCYHTLVSIAREKTVTLWVDQAYRRRFNAQLPQAIFAAQGVGLTAAEIDAAIQIGEFKGKQERDAMPYIYESPPDVDDTPSIPDSPEMIATNTNAPAHEGFRARLRRERVPVRARQSHPKSSEVVPTLWIERDYIQKRLPYLSEGIAQLSEDELTSLAETISEALQQSYWTILGITLSHYLDQKQGERLV
jgi:hypothetical protein